MLGSSRGVGEDGLAQSVWRCRRGIARSAAVTALLCSLTTVEAVAAEAKVGTGSLPTSCPRVVVIRSALQVKLTTVTSQTSIPEYPVGSQALPKGHAPSLVETCTYSTSGRFTNTSNIVPVTISFASSVTKRDFAMARKSASEGAKPVTVKNLGDVAFLVKPPKFDPRAGSSLFVLASSTEIVISAPPSASDPALESLARKLALAPRKLG
jgi:hypothetical protein